MHKLEHADSNRKTQTVLYYPHHTAQISVFQISISLEHSNVQFVRKGLASEDKANEEVTESIKFGPVQE
jgi:hypothetical protein